MSVANESRAQFGSRAIVNASVLVFAASLTLNAGGFVFQAISSRRLGVEAYGTLYALISLYSLAALPISVFAPVVAKYSAEFGALHDAAHVRGLIGWLTRAFFIMGASYVVASMLLALPIAAFLHISPWQIPIVGVMLAVGILSTTMRSIGLGVHAYGTYAGSMAGEGIVRVVALLFFALVGLNMFGALGAFLCGGIAGSALVAIPLVKRYRNVGAKPVLLDWRRIFATTAGATVLTFTMTAMGFADVLLVKHFFPPNQAGLYAVASLCGKILLYFVGFVPAILIPQATHSHARGERTRKLLWSAVAFIAVVSIGGILSFQFAGLLLLHVLTGHAFDAARPLLPAYAAAMAALAMTNSLASYGISTHRLAFVIPLLIATIATLATIALVHPTLGAVVYELMIGNLVMVVCVVAPLAIQGARDLRA